MSRHEKLLDAEKACLVVVDVQERFASHIDGFEGLVKNIVIMLKAASILGLPVIITEQYVKGLGPTVSVIKDAAPEASYFEKNCFPVTGADGFMEHLKNLQSVKQVIVTGIETHVCVNQSVHELLRQGYQVHVVEDAVGSRFAPNKQAALEKMRCNGADLTVMEMALFEMLKEAGTDKFKAVQALVK
ncbi:MAG: hydrolase [Candidatus Obscuribacter sp.]|nr:hydrolase [Candidatus Obscuribacter sp.]MBK9278039.1 hydrolase [Candidatus Obscuribacter sp.]